MSTHRFFIDFEATPFLQTSITGASPNRLNWRAQVLLVENQHHVKNKRVLDLGSHDGRFSYACLKLGAQSIVGIEGRSHLVQNANHNFGQLGYSQEQYQFFHGDVFEQLPRVRTGEFDTILCFGFFYHTTRQVELMTQIARIQPKTLILDTTIDVGLTNKSRSYMQVSLEDPQLEPNTISSPGFIGIPSRALVELLLESFGFKFSELKWLEHEIKDWSHIQDYQSGRRVSYLAESQDSP